MRSTPSYILGRTISPLFDPCRDTVNRKHTFLSENFLIILKDLGRCCAPTAPVVFGKVTTLYSEHRPWPKNEPRLSAHPWFAASPLQRPMRSRYLIACFRPAAGPGTRLSFSALVPSPVHVLNRGEDKRALCVCVLHLFFPWGGRVGSGMACEFCGE